MNDSNQKLLFLQSRTGILLQIIIVLIPALVFLKSGSLLLIGLLISLILSAIFLKLQMKKWTDLGLTFPDNLKRIIISVFIYAIIIIIISFFLRRLIVFLTDEPPNLDAFKAVQGNPVNLIFGLIIIWFFGAFCEEMLFRGFLMNSFFNLLKENQFSDSVKWGISLVITSVITGIGHAYQGTTGMILTGIIAFCFGLIYIYSNKKLLPSVLTHGIYDSIALIMLYSGFNLEKIFH